MEDERERCPICKKEFEKRRAKQMYCSKYCANVASRKRNQKKKQESEEYVKHIRQSKKICTYCGKVYYGKSNSKYCSNSCRYAKQDELSRKKEAQRKVKNKRNRNKKYSKDEQPCWTCKKACGGCRWSDELKPVKGWDAVKVKRKDDSGEKHLTGYRIISCPEYENG